MSDPWAEFRAAPAAPAAASVAPSADAWSDFRPAPAPAPTWSGGVLPVSQGPDGKPQFDSNAGIIGSLKRAFTLPGDVYAGKVDPNSREAVERSFDLAGIANPVNPAVRAGGYGVPGVRPGVVPGKKPVPSAEALNEAASAGYDRARDMGVEYSSDAVAKVAQAIQAKMEQDGIIGELAPKTFAVLNKLTNPPPESVITLGGVEAARRAAGHARKDFNNPTDQLGGRRLVEGLDRWVEAPPQSDVVAGPFLEAGKVLREARGNAAAGARSERLAGLEDSAELRALAANSGRNLDNTLRSRAADILLRPREAAGFVPTEREAIEAIVRGTPVRNRLRDAGNAFGGGGGLGSIVAGGGAGAMAGTLADPLTGTVVGVGVPAVGMIAKTLANRGTKKAWEGVDEMTRKRSPMYEDAVPEMVRPKEMTAYDVVARALLESRPAEATTPGPIKDKALQDRLVKLLMEGGA